MTSTPKDELEAAAGHWDRAFVAEASANRRSATYALASSVYQRHYTNQFFNGLDWVGWLKQELVQHVPFERALVLGCGLGDGLVDFHRRGIARRLHGIDISEAAIAAGRASAAEAGLAHAVTFSTGDFHGEAAERDAFDLVLMVMSLHHAMDMSAVLEHVRSTLEPGGVFVANEYVGPNRWQFTNVQLLLLKALCSALPRDLRVKSDGTVKGRVGRPTLAWMMETDPSEAAHSEEIVAAFAEHFELSSRTDYGGALAIPVLDDIVANFDENDARSMRWFRRVVGLDRLAWRTGVVPSANSILIGRKR